MSKKSNGISQVGFGYGRVIHESTPGIIEGRILTILESIGLPSKQEDALKSLLRSAVWETIMEDSIMISPERHTEIRDLKFKQIRENNGSVPLSAI